MTENGKKILSGLLRTLLKLAVAVVVVVWFCRSYDFNVFKGFASFKYRILIPVFLLSLLAAAAASWRWQALSQTIGIKLTKFKAYSLTLQGMFFSLVIPGGSIGGDVVKMAALSNQVRQGNRTEGIFSIMMDRIVGMIALFALALVLLFYDRSLFESIHLDKMPEYFDGMLLWWLFAGVCTAGLLTAMAVFIHRKIENLPGIKQFIAFADRKSSGKVSRISAAADTYASHGWQILIWVIITLFLIHLTPAISMMLLLAGTGVKLSFIPIVTAVIIGNIAGLIPLFPGGIGTRDAVTIALLVTAGCPPESAATAQLLATAALILFNLTGSLFFIFDRKNTEVQL